MWVVLINLVATLAVVLALMVLALALISVVVLVVLAAIAYGTGRLERAGTRRNSTVLAAPVAEPAGPRRPGPALRPAAAGASGAEGGKRTWRDGVVLVRGPRFTPATAPRGGTPGRGPVRRRRNAEPSPR